MHVVDLPVGRLLEAAWNPNRMGEELSGKLRTSLDRFGTVENLVVRPIGDVYEVVSGNHRLRALRDLGADTAPCFVMDLDDKHARLLAQALNHLHGDDDLGLKAELVRELLEALPEEELLSILPESSQSLASLASLGRESLADRLQAWQRAQEVRLRHLQFQLTSQQIEVVEMALIKVLADMDAPSDCGNPNRRGVALYQLCGLYLQKQGEGRS